MANVIGTLHKWLSWLREAAGEERRCKGNPVAQYLSFSLHLILFSSLAQPGPIQPSLLNEYLACTSFTQLCR